MLNAIGKLRLLTWKYLFYLRYHWFITATEILLPIIFMYSIITLRHYFAPTELSIKFNATVERSTTNVLHAYFPYDTVYYTPVTGQIAAIMKIAAEQILEVTGGRKSGHRVNLKQVPTEREMINFITKDPSNKTAGVVFLQEPITVLEYKIRDKNVWNTDEVFVFAESEISGPYDSDPYLTTGFAPLQSAINRGFTEQVTTYSPVIAYMNLWDTKAEKLQSYYQPFPYPAFIKSTTTTRANFLVILCFLIIIVSLIFCSPLIICIIAEKDSGTKEWIKIAGVSEKLIWLSWFLNSLLISLPVYSILTVILKINFFGENSATIRVVEGSLLWACLILYYTAQIVFCFMFCAMFNSASTASSSFAMTTFVLAFVALKVHDFRNKILVLLSCFFPTGALMQGFLRISYNELLGQPLTWGTVFDNEINSVDASVGYVLCFLIFDILWYLFLTFYINEVNPGRFGFSQPWHFIFGSFSRDSPILKSTDNAIEKNKIKAIFDKYSEKPTKMMTETLVLKDIRKQFGSSQAVRNVNLTLYKDEILVLLGHNGAGKSTTLSMLTGLLVPTSGTIFFKKTIDVLTNLTVFRKSLGLCPQEDRLIPYMTLFDHLLFFGKLKGASDESSIAEATAYLKLMNMDKKSDRLVVQLTNVDKRKLSLSCALMGKAEVLILDEPTAGVEDTSKRRIWNLLKELKINRTIIMTSHSMSESGDIADRIAIMNRGMVVCNGSVDFLKKTFGTGYVLRIVRKRDAQAFAKNLTDPSMQVIDIITRSVGGSRLENRTLTELIFIVPQGASSSFPNLFKTLETQKTALNIESIHVSYAALEHIFLKLGGESVFEEEEKSVNIFSQISPVSNTKKKKEKALGLKLYFNQYTALFEKKYTFIRRNSVTFFFRVIILTILGILLLGGTRKFDKIELPLVLDDSQYKSTKILMAQNENNNFFFFSTFVSFLKELNLKIQNVPGPNMTSALLNYSIGNIASYRREIIFANDLNKQVIFKDDQQKLSQYNFLLTLYNKFMRHSLPIAVNIFDNSLLQFYVKNNSYKIITVNHPIKNIQTSLEQSEEDIGDESPLLAVWFVILAFLTVDLLDYLIIPVKVERIAGFKHIQFLSGISPRTYWISTFVFDVFLFFVILFLRVALFKSFDDYEFITLNLHIAVMLLLFTLFIVSGLLFIYAVSFVQMTKYGSYLFFFIFNILCAFVSFTFYTLQTDALSGIPFSTFQYFTLYVCQGVILIIPPMNFSLAFQKLIMAWRINYLVDVNIRRVMSNKTDALLKGYEKSVSYLETASHRNPNGILLEVIFLFLSIFLYAIMLYCFELDLVYRFLNNIFVKKPTERDDNEESTESGITAAPKSMIPVPKDVAAEHENVEKIVQKLEDEVGNVTTDEFKTTDESHAPKHAVIANSLEKVYWRILTPSSRAVTDISFATKVGECFGLLGHEGAGRSTILKMLTGVMFPTKGEAWVYNIRLDKNRMQYFSKIGYCPESTTYLDELTGRETLEYIATLNGIDTKDIKEETEKWIRILDLEDVQNKNCDTYSEGYRRKICTAMAFIGDPKVVFLDGPTVGIDPFARFKLFNTINQSKKAGQTILFTSHSIGECETLCDRITVLVNGRMRFIGSINDMKMTYAQGFVFMIKLKDKFPGEKDAVREENVNKVKKVVMKSFSLVTLKHETDNILQYEIKETATWSTAFQKTEEIKKAQSLIVEYQLTETNLEDVYASFYETIK